ncbi:Protein phosphatase 2A, regulatory B subunit, B56 [Carpediemonas membranifera]|uniref:Protein phosphatase 2A, regulatory B subunit, B56 n=1 Tax=Carpediemonas membranifera TaxID=201153 RepID=A0A8J6B456_9EUKA|nr:Protein phosphatase 2A, regulatory B subunit, B56 [Carpediemonas membranifera]|eukprot:KAG9389652.1 Protein phosphatase 2A, regulatory B subunit, B56 [Carpediemonas membranifera]
MERRRRTHHRRHKNVPHEFLGPGSGDSDKREAVAFNHHHRGAENRAIIADNTNYPSIGLLSPLERTSMLNMKLKQCTGTSFIRPGDEINSRTASQLEVKRRSLLDVLDHVAKTTAPFASPETVSALMGMIAANIIHPTNEIWDAPGHVHWPVLQLVHETFLRFIMDPSVEPRTLKHAIRPSLIARLVDQLRTDDAEEREYLKTELHRIYTRAPGHRPLVRRLMTAALEQYAATPHRHGGVAELLEVYGTIIKGLSAPLKAEYGEALHTAFMPLHRVENTAPFHDGLSRCVVRLVEKDAGLAVVVVRDLIRYWPLSNPGKAVKNLSELESILALTPLAMYDSVMPLALHLFGLCVSSHHEVIAEAALRILLTQTMRAVIKDQFEIALDTLVFPLLYNTQKHASTHVQVVSARVLMHSVVWASPLTANTAVQSCRDQIDAGTTPAETVELWDILLDMVAHGPEEGGKVGGGVEFGGNGVGDGKVSVASGSRG